MNSRLHHLFGHHLMTRMRVAVGFLGGPIAQVHVAQQEDPLPGHQHIVEEDNGIHLLKARAQGMVKVGAAQVETLPA